MLMFVQYVTVPGCDCCQQYAVISVQDEPFEPTVRKGYERFYCSDSSWLVPGTEEP